MLPSYYLLPESQVSLISEAFWCLWDPYYCFKVVCNFHSVVSFSWIRHPTDHISSFEFSTPTKLNPSTPHQTQSNVDTSIRLCHSLDSLISHPTYHNHTYDDPNVLRTLILLSRHIVDDILFGAVEWCSCTVRLHYDSDLALHTLFFRSTEESRQGYSPLDDG